MPGEPTHPHRLAIVFSGGGAKGAFGIGVLHGLVERLPDLRWDVVTGSSTGAIIAPFAALGSHDRARLDAVRDLYVAARRGDVLGNNLRRLWRLALPTGFYHSRPLAGLIEQHMDHAFVAALEASPAAMVINAVSLGTGDRVLFTQTRHRDAIERWYLDKVEPDEVIRVEAVTDRAQLARAIRASSAIPVAIEPVPLDADLLVDGGVLDIAPLRPAIAAGATHVLTILMSPRRSTPHEGTFSNLIRVGMRAIELVSDEVMRNDVRLARMISSVTAVSRRLDDAPAEVRQWCEQCAPELVEPDRHRVIEVETIEPAHDLGRVLDFESACPPGWPEGGDDGGSPASMPIMQARYEYGRRHAWRCLDADASLRRLLAPFAGSAV